MASIINATTSSGIQNNADNSGILAIQSAGTTASAAWAGTAAKLA